MVTKLIPIGRAKGPGEKTFEFNFITPDKDKVKIGEYIYYNAVDSGGISHKILSRVALLEPIRLFPDSMLSDPTLDPVSISQTIDFSNPSIEVYQVNAQIIGYYDRNLTAFVNPRSPPSPGDAIYIASKEELIDWLSQKKKGEVGGVFVGHLLNRLQEEIPAVLDVEKLVNMHLAVLAATGSGKSYTVGVILEELLMPNNRGAVLVFDPHGEYETFPEIKYLKEFKGDDGYIPKVDIIEPDKIKIKLAELNMMELEALLENMSDKMKNVLDDAIESLQRDNATKDCYTVEQLYQKVVAMDPKASNPSVQGILWRINAYLRRNPLIDDTQTIYLQDILEPGKITIMKISEMESRYQQVITSVILNRVLKSRIKAKKGTLEPNDRNGLPYPVFVVLEEGHKFAPNYEESRSKKVIKTILSEGRKFGVGVCIISQRPGKLDSDVLSQCMTQIVMRMKNESDQQNIKSSLESFSQDMINELPGLTTGQAIISGVAVNAPILVQIRKRLIKHGGASQNPVTIWQDYKKTTVPKKRKADNQDETLT